MNTNQYSIQFFPMPPAANSGGSCGGSSCSQSEESSCRRGSCCSCAPQRDIDEVLAQLRERSMGKYSFYIASYQTMEEITQAISVFNSIMVTSQETVRVSNVNELFQYLYQYAPLTAINERLIYVQNTPAASHIEHAIDTYF